MDAVVGGSKFRLLYRLDFGMKLGRDAEIVILRKSLDSSCNSLLDIPNIVDELKILVRDIEEERGRMRDEPGDDSIP